MHDMQTVVTDVCGVCLSVSLYVTPLNSALLCGVIRCSLCQIILASCFVFALYCVSLCSLYDVLLFKLIKPYIKILYVCLKT